MPDPVFADSFEDSPVSTPVQPPVHHVVVGAVVDDAAVLAFGRFGVGAVEPKPGNWLAVFVPFAGDCDAGA